MKKVPQLIDFEGLWQIDRRIENRLGADGHFVGQARFTAKGSTMICREEGMLDLAGTRMRATRGYLWRAEGGHIVVEHEGGAPFHAFDPARPEAVHLCAPDRYRVVYDFAGWPDWCAVWTVSGPAKDYTSVSRYRRASGRGG